MSSTSSYEAPIDYIQQKGSQATVFSQSALMSSGKELWVLRIPDNVSAKDLDGLTIKNPQSTADGIVLQKAKINGRSYQIVTPRATNISAELKGMAELNVLVPDDEDEQDKLTLMPSGFVQTMSLIENIDIPLSTDLATEIAERVRPARAQPENMQLRFIPYGFYSADEYRQMAADKTPGAAKKRSAEDAAMDDQLQVASQDPTIGTSSAAVSDQETTKKQKKSKDKKDKKDKKEKREKKSKKSKESKE
ncbi:hypothetical protein H4R99_006053 [Coemansia sp. RSA 1722]|nr:hypothetical protein IWW45_003527 [Coemansia sp. RSA 485]KAJ2593577.1 hypothetical protein H4R99_006053 [Coemansia sp. RSA 1722]